MRIINTINLPFKIALLSIVISVSFAIYFKIELNFQNQSIKNLINDNSHPTGAFGAYSSGGGKINFYGTTTMKVSNNSSETDR